ncbi:hypothetical protein CDD80_4431 [Ophiocordyceps camponoti-rufipedis]|uniref:ribonuclease T2 n=1 Tax=Ophiocordyceps camponoti-rufipedis TaxID=2004952 RepID=A0A2C5YZV2_9HYPO|nr:hypothetical protein CDD80_4431 [Ophiocordyceps camponoti-rufipedis]
MHPIASFLLPSLATRSSCPSDIPLSCHNSSAVDDTCCFIPAGQLLQTQFWDVNPSTGPSDSWTIHGLWPDNCDGSYPQACDSSRADYDVRSVLQDAHKSDTLAYMNRYWKDYKGDDDHLWEHEWSKHGTCVTTLDPSCFGSGYRRGDDAIAYFDRAVELFKTLPTHDWLAAADIKPSFDDDYDLTDIQDTLAARHGAPVTLRCRGNALTEVWYHFNVKGSLQEGRFVAADPDGPKGSCPRSVRYIPKRNWAQADRKSSQIRLG